MKSLSFVATVKQKCITFIYNFRLMSSLCTWPTLIDVVRRNYHTVSPSWLVLTYIIKCENIIKHSHVSIRKAFIFTVAGRPE